jgi:hypothetical protein
MSPSSLLLSLSAQLDQATDRLGAAGLLVLSARCLKAVRISAESLAFGAKVSGSGADFCNSEELFDFRADCVSSGPDLLMRFLWVLAWNTPLKTCRTSVEQRFLFVSQVFELADDYIQSLRDVPDFISTLFVHFGLTPLLVALVSKLPQLQRESKCSARASAKSP